MAEDGETAAGLITQLEHHGSNVLHGTWETLFVDSFPQDVDGVVVSIPANESTRASLLLKRLRTKLPKSSLFLLLEKEEPQFSREFPLLGIMGVFPFTNDSKVMDRNLALVTDHCSLKKQMARINQENLKMRREFFQGMEWESVFGISNAMQKLRRQVERVSRSGLVPVLIQGEPGNGKETLARLLHDLSPRGNQPFYRLNAGSISDSNFDAMMFGTQKSDGSQEPGILDRVQGGTLYIERVGELPFTVQGRLLALFEKKEFWHPYIGENRSLDIRLICSTYHSLQGLVNRSAFRQDLYYLLSVVELALPPLRERKEDILPLAERYLASFRDPTSGPTSFSKNAQSALMSYDFPENLLELRMVVEHAAKSAKTQSVELEDLILPNAQGPQKLRPSVSLDLNLEKMSQDFVEQAMVLAEGNQTKAAEILGIGHDALRYKLQKWGWLKKGRRGFRPTSDE